MNLRFWKMLIFAKFLFHLFSAREPSIIALEGWQLPLFFTACNLATRGGDPFVNFKLPSFNVKCIQQLVNLGNPFLSSILIPKLLTYCSHIFVCGSCFLLCPPVRLPSVRLLPPPSSFCHTTFSHATLQHNNFCAHSSVTHNSSTHNSCKNNFVTHTTLSHTRTTSSHTQLLHTHTHTHATLSHTHTKLCHTHT